MKWLRLVVLCCGLAVVGGARSLFASPEAVWICCTDPEDCGNGLVCCSNGILERPPCTDNEPAYCVVLCAHPGGGGDGR